MGSAVSQNSVEKTETKKGSENIQASSKSRAKSVKEAIKTVQRIKSFFDNNGKLSDEKWDAISYLLDVSKFLQRITSQEAVRQTSEIADMLIKETIVDVMCELLYIVYDGEIKNCKHTEGLNTLKSIQAFTACSEKFCIAVCKNPLFFDTVKKVLENPKDLDSVSEVLLILRNISLRESCVTYVRDVPDIVKTLTSCLKSGTIKDFDRFWKIAILAAIITHDELATINADENLLQNCLVKPFKECLENEELMSKLCSCTDLTIIIRMIAKNKENNQRLGKVNCLELLVKFEEKAKTNEKLECMKAILALASDTDNRKTMVTDNQLIDRLLQLSKSDRKDDKKLKENSNVILWSLREELLDSEKYKKLGASYYKNGEKNTVESDGEHIMISYQWDKQKEVKQIKDRLATAGHKVWIDVEQIGGGSTLQAMADAVENAKIVLIFITKKYEASPNCQKEVEYACTLKKRIIPIKLENDYQPRGVVGLIVGAKLYHEFTDKYPFELRMAGLLRDVAKDIPDQGPTTSERMVTPPPTMEMTSPPSVTEAETQTSELSPSNETQMTCRFTLESVRRWTSTDVQAWIDNNGLNECKIDDRTGDEIALFVTLSREPNYYLCRCLEKMWDVQDPVILSKLVWAFNDLAIEINKSTVLVHRIDRNGNTRFSRVELSENDLLPKVN